MRRWVCLVLQLRGPSVTIFSQQVQGTGCQVFGPVEGGDVGGKVVIIVVLLSLLDIVK